MPRATSACPWPSPSRSRPTAGCPTAPPSPSAVGAVDAAAAPDYFLVNCAHPTHVAGGLSEGAWRQRIVGLRCNASIKSHAELDDAVDLDEGDPAELASAHRQLEPLLPNLTIVGGCCGTDARHVAALWADAAR